MFVCQHICNSCIRYRKYVTQYLTETFSKANWHVHCHCLCGKWNFLFSKYYNTSCLVKKAQHCSGAPIILCGFHDIESDLQKDKRNEHKQERKRKQKLFILNSGWTSTCPILSADVCTSLIRGHHLPNNSQHASTDCAVRIYQQWIPEDHMLQKQ